MCGGPSSTQSELQQEEADFYKTQIGAYNKAYANFSDISAKLAAQFDPILKAGPGQMGYTQAELTDLNTMASEGTAGYYKQAQQAAAEGEATLGGGTSNINITSGAAADTRARIAAAAAGQSAQQRLMIQQSGYDVGRQQWQQAIQGTETLAAGWNPNSFSGSAVNAGNSASSEANTIAQQQQSAWQSVLGAVGGIAGNVTSPKIGGWGLGK
jgi:hypothetical protein